MTDLAKLTIDHADKHLVGEIAIPKGAGPFPVVLVMANAYGLGDQVRQSARLLAAQGYAAVCTDMYGNGAHFAGPAAAKDSDYMTLMQNPDLMRERIDLWHQTAASQPRADASRTAAIGYCFGGANVLELARSGADVRAVVSYHGVLKTLRPAEPGTIKALVTAYCGADDPYAPLQDIEALGAEMRAAKARHQITTFSHVGHSFTDPDADKYGMPGLAYDAVADAVSWAGTLAVLDQTLKR